MRDGGPAFPRPHSTAEWGEYIDDERPAQPGMSLRDYFAGQVLASESIPVGALVDEDAGAQYAKDVAEYAYVLADAMIEARGVEHPPDVQETLLNGDDEGV